MTVLELRPRLATEIVDAAFQLYRRHFGALLSLSALAFGPFIALQLLVLGGEAVDPTAGDAAGAGVVLLFGWLVGSLLEAAIVVAVSNSYLHDEPDVASALRRTRSRFFAVLFAVTAKWFLITIGFVVAMFVATIGAAITMIGTGGPAGGAAGAVIVAGVVVLLSVPVALYFFASYFAVPATVILEGLGVGAGLARSRELSKGSKMRVLGALGIPMLAYLIFRMVVAGVATFLPGPPLIGYLIDQFAMVVAYPLMAVIATLLYYDTRIRKEGFDIEVMAAELEPSPAGEPAVSPPPAGA